MYRKKLLGLLLCATASLVSCNDNDDFTTKPTEETSTIETAKS